MAGGASMAAELKMRCGAHRKALRTLGSGSGMVHEDAKHVKCVYSLTHSLTHE